MFPYVCAEEEICPYEQYWDWDSRQGWSWALNVPLHTFAKRLQSWLFFGLVSFYVGYNVPPTRLLERYADGRSMINFIGENSLLQPLLDAALSSITQTQDANTVIERHLRVQEGLRAAMSFMDLMVIPYLNEIDDGCVQDIWSSEAHAIIFGVDILIDTLIEQIKASHPVSRLFARYTYRRLSLAAEVRVIRESVFPGGRCRSLAGRLRPLSKTWYKIIHLPPTGVVEDHKPCTFLHCRRNDQQEKTYKTQHTDTCLGCASLRSDPKALVTAVSLDKIPLIDCSFSPRKGWSIRVIQGDLSFRYTAISHVWTGGLGSSQNALPECQVSRLWKMINDLPDMQAMNVEHIGDHEDDDFSEKLVRLMESALNLLRPRKRLYFWLDTLCVPLEKGLRLRAIKSMAQIYAAAQTVLVLDPHLQQLPDIRVTEPIFFTHLIVSPWMSRSWPLQEGSVAANLAVRLRDRSVFLTRRHQKRLLRVSVQLTDCLSEKRLYQNPTYTAVWNALACRGTKERADLDGIFAALLNLDQGEILKLQEHERMKAIISTQNSIPLTLLCLPKDKDAIHHSWIPRFPDTSSELVCLYDHHGVLIKKADGFLLSISADSSTFGIWVQNAAVPRGKFVLKDSHNEMYYRISIDAQAPTVASPKSPSSLFLLTYDRVTGSSWYRGSHLEILVDEETTTRLKFISSFSWGDVGIVSSVDQVLEGHRFLKLGSDTHETLLVADIASWPKPQWHRLDQFPFVGIVSVHFEKWTAAYYPSFVLTSVLGFIPTAYALDIDTLATVGKYFIPGWWLLARAMYSLVERALWQRWLAQCVQQRWAATFHNNAPAKALLSAKSPTLSFALWTYAPIFFLAFGSLMYSWTYPPLRMAFFWISLTLFAEPLVCLGFTTIMDLRQRLEASDQTDPFPFRSVVALLLCTTGAVPCIALMVKDLLFTGPWEMEGLELRVFEISLLWFFTSVFGCGFWATGLLSVLYLNYKGKIPSSGRLASVGFGAEKGKAD